MLTNDQQALLRKITTTVIVVQSGKDESLSPAASAAMQEQLRKAGKKNIDWVLYPNLDHGLSNPEGTSEATRVTAGIHHWLQSRLKVDSGE